MSDVKKIIGLEECGEFTKEIYDFLSDRVHFPSFKELSNKRISTISTVSYDNWIKGKWIKK